MQISEQVFLHTHFTKEMIQNSYEAKYYVKQLDVSMVKLLTHKIQMESSTMGYFSTSSIELFVETVMSLLDKSVNWPHIM